MKSLMFGVLSFAEFVVSGFVHQSLQLVLFRHFQLEHPTLIESARVDKSRLGSEILIDLCHLAFISEHFSEVMSKEMR